MRYCVYVNRRQLDQQLISLRKHGISMLIVSGDNLPSHICALRKDRPASASAQVFVQSCRSPRCLAEETFYHWLSEEHYLD